MPNPMDVRNLIIDLGGVLYATDQDRTLEAFKALIPVRHQASLPRDLRHLADHPVFRELETGRLSPEEFRRGMRREFGIEADDAAIDEAWNALLDGVIPGRVADLQKLREKYRMVLLSNTNVIHMERIAEDLAPVFACFERCYLSYEMGLRKPQREIYDRVLAESGMEAGQSLFIDDSEVNIAGGRACGLQVFRIGEEAGETWDDLLSML